MRKHLFKWHSYAALIAMLPLLIISFTGSILVFKVEIDSWLRPAHMLVAETGPSPRQNLDNLMDEVLAKNTDFELGGWELFDNKSRTDAGYLIKRGTDQWFKVYINQYTGELLSSPQPMEHYLTDWLLELHYSFLLHLKGAVIGLISALFMFFLGLSGMILYRRFWVKLFTLRFNSTKRILFSDTHKFIGIVSSPVLLLTAFTGAYWNLIGIIHELDEHSGEEHAYITQPFYSSEISFESIRQQSGVEITGFKAGYLAIPHEKEEQIVFYGEVPSNNPFNSEYASMVTFDKTTGKLIGAHDIRTADTLSVFLDSFRKLHFGYFGGIFTRILWCILGLMPVILAFTGLYLYWQRQKQRRVSRRSRRRLAI